MVSHKIENKIAPQDGVVFTIRQLKTVASRMLLLVGIECPKLEADVLLEHVLRRSRLEILTEGQEIVSEQHIRQFFTLLASRLTFVPIAYLTGEKEFFGLNLYVDVHCLIPRPDTETVVEAALKIIPDDKPFRILDLCSGSGAIGIALLAHRPQATCVFLDISLGALSIAKKNAARHGLSHRSEFVQSDLWKSLDDGSNEQFDIIVSNPPYLSEKEITEIPTDLTYEPRSALFGGDKDGLFFYRQIFSKAKEFLRPRGFLVLEIGYQQKHLIEPLIERDFRLIEFFLDLGHNTRGVIVQLS